MFQARQVRGNNTVAIKIIAIDDPQALEDVRKEIRILSECNHPNIVKYLGSYFKDQNLWVCKTALLAIFRRMMNSLLFFFFFSKIAMEYCGGGSVCDIMMIQDAPMQEEQIAYICREALKGLQYEMK